MRVAKDQRIPIFIVGHVTKSGDVAGPKVLEHIVDTTLYMEGEHGQSFRLLRVNKNRFGKTDEVALQKSCRPCSKLSRILCKASFHASHTAAGYL